MTRTGLGIAKFSGKDFDMMYYELELYDNKEIVVRNVPKDCLIDMLDDYMVVYENKESININEGKTKRFYYTSETERNDMVSKILTAGNFFA